MRIKPYSSQGLILSPNFWLCSATAWSNPQSFTWVRSKLYGNFFSIAEGRASLVLATWLLISFISSIVGLLTLIRRSSSAYAAVLRWFSINSEQCSSSSHHKADPCLIPSSIFKSLKNLCQGLKRAFALTGGNWKKSPEGKKSIPPKGTFRPVRVWARSSTRTSPLHPSILTSSKKSIQIPAHFFLWDIEIDLSFLVLADNPIAVCQVLPIISPRKGELLLCPWWP